MKPRAITGSMRTGGLACRAAGNAARICMVVGIFVLGWLATCLLLRPIQPPLDVPQLGQKLDWLSSEGEHYDTIFLGSSRVRRHLSPKVFDATMRENGVPTSSFNLGIDGMTFPELSYVLKEGLRRAEGLRYVIIDVNPLRRRMMRGSDLQSLREIHWHDLTHTKVAWSAVLSDFLAGKTNLPATARLFATHAVLLGRHYSSTGKCAGVLPGYLGVEELPTPIPKFQTRGFFAVKDALKAEQRELYLQRLEEMTSLEVRPTLRAPVLERSLAAAAKEVRNAGATPIFILSPVVSGERLPTPGPDLSSAPVVVAFDDPNRYPELYIPEHRYDLQHLNSKGAKLLTRLLALELASLGKASSPQ